MAILALFPFKRIETRNIPGLLCGTPACNPRGHECRTEQAATTLATGADMVGRSGEEAYPRADVQLALAVRERTAEAHDAQVPRASRAPTPLEGLEHVLSILHNDVERQLPRNYTGSLSLDYIKRRPKTANNV
ncbi:hypothetical protein [Microbacterium aurantiacum]|uniref:hypothetical protein n=1 Tax=Microbacterium aurantiacum TaxID=162393 RepID=UPI003F49952C